MFGPWYARLATVIFVLTVDRVVPSLAIVLGRRGGHLRRRCLHLSPRIAAEAAHGCPSIA